MICVLVFSCVALILPVAKQFCVVSALPDMCPWHAGSVMHSLSLADSPPASHSYLNEALNEAMCAATVSSAVQSECCLTTTVTRAGCLLVSHQQLHSQAHIQDSKCYCSRQGMLHPHATEGPKCNNTTSLSLGPCPVAFHMACLPR